ncbi:MAG: hypothetical protein QP950_08240 [Staphylococcus warneri]|uniref:hypothetical protein n=1 Tax=Staphylococcus TaxID=1279 RepID=UPI000910E7EA|nr:MULTISPECIES: hypothetical protein [Staphylococcus]MBF2232807.1 hypothetical protein [Staphylococcus epidermidis]MCF7582255.1 hypothetical protein [Staphylococcus epidermidis]MCG2193582.1 hypothetical protein [Staphylococcus epidermidis]MCM3483487.1 hypothetical protein [Staphylococcus warneri]MCR4501851.1 hypothetical protein [Staphylococcus warneri]
MKEILKKVGIGAGKVAAVPLIVAGAAISALYETTGDRQTMRQLLEDRSDKDLMEYYAIHKDGGDHDTYIAAGTLLIERGYSYNEETEKWEK